VNCGALSEGVLESELFGHEKELSRRPVSSAGKFEMADGGTLFLDEIGDISLKTQIDLLRPGGENHHSGWRKPGYSGRLPFDCGNKSESRIDGYQGTFRGIYTG
jgi:hypothetical protein